MLRNRKDEQLADEYLEYLHSLPQIETTEASLVNYPIPTWEEELGEWRLSNRDQLIQFIRNTPTGICIPVLCC